MVEQHQDQQTQENVAADSGSAVNTGSAQVAQAEEEGKGQAATGEGGNQWVTTDSYQMDAEEQANLAVFLQKIQKACKKDSEVPDFLGPQVDQWLQEIYAEQQPAGAQQDDGAMEDTGAGPGGSTGEAP